MFQDTLDWVIVIRNTTVVTVNVIAVVFFFEQIIVVVKNGVTMEKGKHATLINIKMVSTLLQYKNICQLLHKHFYYIFFYHDILCILIYRALIYTSHY